MNEHMTSPIEAMSLERRKDTPFTKRMIAKKRRRGWGMMWKNAESQKRIDVMMSIMPRNFVIIMIN